MSLYSEVVAAVDPSLKANAYEVLAAKNISVSDFIRSAMIHLVEQKEVPFDIKRVRPGRYKHRREQVPA